VVPKFCIEPKAVVSHECYASFRMLYSHFLFSRLQAARRAQIFFVEFPSTLILSLAAPVVLPWLQTLSRLGKVLGGTHNLSNAWLRSIPIMYLIHSMEVLGKPWIAGQAPETAVTVSLEENWNAARIARQS